MYNFDVIIKWGYTFMYDIRRQINVQNNLKIQTLALCYVNTHKTKSSATQSTKESCIIRGSGP